LFGGPASEDERTLVLIQLNGGNDGLSTLVPFGDDAYYRVRKATRLEPDALHRVDDYVGLHPSLAHLARRYQEGQVALIQGVGYPGSNRSHFKSREIWHTADLRGRAGNDGWIGRLCDQAWAASTLPELSVHVGQNLPFSLYSPLHPPVVFNTPDSYRWLGDEGAAQVLDSSGDRRSSSVLERLRGVMADARSSSARILRAIREYETDVEYAGNRDAQALKHAAALIDARLGSRVLSVVIGGFDTHANQKADHSALLRLLDRALESFLSDLQRSEAGRKTLVLAFSEFGRRVKENGSGGTDHGKASLMFALGKPVAGGLYGEYPSLTDLDDQDLRFNVDFRRAYATAIEWMGGDARETLGAAFEPVPYLG
jgi:uncharacterized protein (DUF1501 family)